MSKERVKEFIEKVSIFVEQNKKGIINLVDVSLAINIIFHSINFCFTTVSIETVLPVVYFLVLCVFAKTRLLK